MSSTFRGLMRYSPRTFIAVVAAASLIAGCGPSAEEPKPPPPVASPAPKPKPATGKNGLKKHSLPVSSRQQLYRQKAQAAQKGQ